MADSATIGGLVVGTIALRPYVFAFLGVYLVVASRDVGVPRALAWLAWGWLVAYVAEYTSTRMGVPFGLYHYTGHTAGEEVFLANVPLFSSLSFPFLAYAAWCLMRLVRGASRDLGAVVGAGVLMMLLDAVIDPLAVRGDRWFLGDLFFYEQAGWFFGVPLSNFGGWMAVGSTIVGGLVWTRFLGAERHGDAARLGAAHGGAALYYAILLFNLAIAVWIGEVALLAVGIALHAVLGLALLRLARHAPLADGERWTGADRAGSAAMHGGTKR